MNHPMRRGIRHAHRHAREPTFAIRDPAGREFRIPASLDEDYEYFSCAQGGAIRDYFDANGYVVVRGLVPPQYCESALRWFRDEVAPSNRYVYRQTTANPERHIFTPHGYMLNPILNVQSLGGRHYPRFRQSGLAVFTYPAVRYVLEELLDEPGKLVQSMFFEGNSATWAHQDTYYLDAEEVGRMVGAWFALEDIAPGAGRFYVYPKSHRIDMDRNGGDIDIAFHHERYKELILDAIRERGLECRAPALQQGDALFWSSRTLHGSLETRQPERSRSSFTAHYIPDSSRFLQFQSRIRGLDLDDVSGMRVHRPKDLDRPSRRALFWVETAFPKSFRFTKKLAIKAFTR
jgi:phytanoyl-CoA hydroxylase